MTTGNENLTAARSLDQFVSDTAEQAAMDGRFANESARMLRVDVDGGVWLKPGAAVAYRGDIRFERQRVLSAPSVRTALLRETAPLVYASGRGRLFCAHHGSHASGIALSGETIFVAWPDLLAFEESLECVPTLVDHGVSLAAGGLVVMRLSGHGSLAVVSHGRPLSLAVTRGQPVCTDPHATIGWSAGLRVQLKTDLTWRSALQHGGHEAVQMLFEGEGFVIVQPFEDPGRFTVRVTPLKRLASLLAG
jgi:uncharacterized protein (AIM24 family)